MSESNVLHFLVCQEGTSDKFYEIAITPGHRVLSRYGRNGTVGAVTFKDFDSADEAMAYVSKLYQEKSKKGYLPVEQPGARASTQVIDGQVDSVVEDIQVGKEEKGVKKSRKPLATATAAPDVAPEAKRGRKRGAAEIDTAIANVVVKDEDQAASAVHDADSRALHFLVCQEGTSDKFYEIAITPGHRVLSRYGRNGTVGAVTFKDFDSADEAMAYVSKLYQEKSKKGYLPVEQTAIETTNFTDPVNISRIPADLIVNPHTNAVHHRIIPVAPAGSLAAHRMPLPPTGVIVERREYMECHEGTAFKFYDIALLSDHVVVTIYGRIGSAGTRNQEQFHSSMAAFNNYQMTIQSKLNKGYRYKPLPDDTTPDTITHSPVYIPDKMVGMDQSQAEGKEDEGDERNNDEQLQEEPIPAKRGRKLPAKVVETVATTAGVVSATRKGRKRGTATDEDIDSDVQVRTARDSAKTFVVKEESPSDGNQSKKARTTIIITSSGAKGRAQQEVTDADTVPLHYLTCTTGGCHKFYEICLVKSSVPSIVSRYGRIGSAGVKVLKDFDDEKEAMAHAHALLAEKENKGYKRVATAAP